MPMIAQDKLKHYRSVHAEKVKSTPFARLSLEDTRAQTREAVKVNTLLHEHTLT